MHEEQLTHGKYGHMINSIQIFSPDDEWIVYDTRNDQTHIGKTCCIEKVNVRTKEIVRLYSTPDQSVYGPGVGAASWHPSDDRIIFIHGLLNCNQEHPYGFTRRFGALLDGGKEGSSVVAAEARTVTDPLLPGALRGGTHAHSWSGDGEWISFTYNDVIVEKLESSSRGLVRDLRTIGVMAPAGPVEVPRANAENFSGQFFSTVVATVTEHPAPGTDEIEKAFDECWIGRNGYLKRDGSRQIRAIAFQGHVRDANDSVLSEVFVADIPDDITAAENGRPLQGTFTTRPSVPKGIVQRRLTFTSARKHPGLQGPRFWLRSSPDGSQIYFLMKDDRGIVQIYSVDVTGGDVQQVTELSHSVAGQFNISPDGRSIALIADNSIWIADIRGGEAQRVTPRSPDASAPVLGVVWNNGGSSLAYNRYVESEGVQYLQIFHLSVHPPV